VRSVYVLRRGCLFVKNGAKSSLPAQSPAALPEPLSGVRARMSAQEMSSTKRPRELPTEVMSAAYWNQNTWKWSVEVGDPSGKGGRLIAQGTTAKQQFGIGARNGRVVHIGERLLNLFDLDHSYEVIEKVNAVIDAELANRETRGVQGA